MVMCCNIAYFLEFFGEWRFYVDIDLSRIGQQRAVFREVEMRLYTYPVPFHVCATINRG